MSGTTQCHSPLSTICPYLYLHSLFSPYFAVKTTDLIVFVTGHYNSFLRAFWVVFETLCSCRKPTLHCSTCIDLLPAQVPLSTIGSHDAGHTDCFTKSKWTNTYPSTPDHIIVTFLEALL
ncbi:hypothetical protein CEXT_288321 [Caerostris extrusa]|uniref:Uncharacterized protein n=1 Tax=Caerostris extrusa TaxID=172846 RepID=A0AAV4MN82_CAEEX|nr:hypothetical protein CEXT_288321 [Caerostris extrusa]